MIVFGAALLALSAALPAAARAQGARPVPYVGVATGREELPDVFQDQCAPGSTYALEGRAGVARGALAIEARGALLGDFSDAVCALAFDPVPPPREGTRAETTHPFDQGRGHATADLRVRLGGTRGLPVSVSGGAGWMLTERVPYLLAGAGVRTGGKLHLVLDAGWSWYRVPSDLVVIEWKDYRPVREVSRTRRYDWRSGPGVRLGVELPFRP